MSGSTPKWLFYPGNVGGGAADADDVEYEVVPRGPVGGEERGAKPGLPSDVEAGRQLHNQDRERRTNP